MTFTKASYRAVRFARLTGLHYRAALVRMALQTIALPVAVLMAGCSQTAQPPVLQVVPAVAADFCSFERDGEYAHPTSCKGFVVCARKKPTVQGCPEGQVIDATSTKRPLVCTPIAETRLDANCKIQPRPVAAAS